MKLKVGETAVLVLLLAAGGVARGTCDNLDAPSYLRLRCAISQGGCGGRVAEEGVGRVTNACDLECQVQTGLELEVACSQDGREADPDLVLYKDGHSFGASNQSWPFATPEERGLYVCRWRNGSLYANRTIVPDEHVYVIPGEWSSAPSYSQQCFDGLVRNFSCSTAHQSLLVDSRKPASVSVPFHVMGARPIALGAEVVWANHYPVDLHLTLSRLQAWNSSTSHSVAVSLQDLAFVGNNNSVSAYLVITGTTPSRSSSMCVNLRLIGGACL
jgi:hypothetical protein